MPDIEKNLEFGKGKQVVKIQNSHAIQAHDSALGSTSMCVLLIQCNPASPHNQLPQPPPPQVSLFPFSCVEGLPEAGQGHGEQVLQMSKAATSTSVLTGYPTLYDCQCSCRLLRACESGLSTVLPRCLQMELRQSSQSDSNLAKQQRLGRHMNRQFQQEM